MAELVAASGCGCCDDEGLTRDQFIPLKAVLGPGLKENISLVKEQHSLPSGTAIEGRLQVGLDLVHTCAEIVNGESIQRPLQMLRDFDPLVKSRLAKAT